MLKGIVALSVTSHWKCLMMQRSKGICLLLVWNTCFTLTCLIMLIQDKVSAGVSYRKLGCFKDNGQRKRPLPQLLFTDRHYLSPVYSGRKFITESFDRSYLDDLVGRCASKCKQLGYDVFGIGKFAECYSGDGAYKTYKNDGPTKQCYTSKYQPCNFKCESVPCAGSIHTIFVYKLGTPSNPRPAASISTKSTQPTSSPSKRKSLSTRSSLSRPTKLPSRGTTLPTRETLPTTESKTPGCCTVYTPIPSICPPHCQTSCSEVCPSTCCVATPLHQLTVYSSPVSPLTMSTWCPYPCSSSYMKRKDILWKRKYRNFRRGRHSLLSLKRSFSNKASGHITKKQSSQAYLGDTQPLNNKN